MKLNYKIFLLLILFITPFDYAFASSNISISCPVGGKVESIIDCEILANSDIEISAVRTNLSVSNNLQFIDFKTDSSWQGNGSNGEISLYTYPNQIGKFKLGVLSVKILDNSTNRTGTLYLNDIYFYKADFSRFSGISVSKNIKVLSNNNDLASLSLIGYNITPKFRKDITEYQATVDSETVVIEAKSEDEFATINGIGKKELNYDKNIFTIIVTSEANTKKEYKLTITRPNTIKEENNSSKENFHNQNIETSNKNDEKLEKPKDNNSKLQNLVIDSYDIDFNSDMYDYYINISSKLDKLSINAVPSSDKATVTIKGNERLVFGMNEVIITVAAEDGSKSIYTIHVTKKSDICVVKTINISNYDLDFDCNQYDYELEINNEDSLNIEIIPISDQAKINIYNNANLKHEDIITISVRVNDTDYKYNIKVLKNNFEIENIVNTKQLIFLILIIIFILLYLIGRFLIKRKISM